MRLSVKIIKPELKQRKQTKEAKIITQEISLVEKGFAP